MFHVKHRQRLCWLGLTVALARIAAGFRLSFAGSLSQDRGHHAVGKRPGRLRVLNPAFKHATKSKILTPPSNSPQIPKTHRGGTLPKKSTKPHCQAHVRMFHVKHWVPSVWVPLYTVRHTYLPQHRVLARDSGCLTSQMFHVKLTRTLSATRS